MATAQFRASAPLFDSHPVAPGSPSLGPLLELPGTWMGEGFNLVLLPDFENKQPFQIKLAKTMEILEFRAIGATIPNRGSAQDDIEFLGVHYLQRVNDAINHSALHLEPGLWLNLPATTSPAEGATVVRQATIPHGDSLLAQGTSLVVSGGPKIAFANSTPLKGGVPITDPAYLSIITNAVPPMGIPKAAVANPNLVIQNAMSGQNIIETTVLQVSTTPVGGIINIPFVVTNANATSMSAIFWIEKVKQKDGRITLQLQYTQRVILNFLGIDWPHISVATLVKR